MLVWEMPETIEVRKKKLEAGFEVSSDEETEELSENIMYIKDNIIPGSSKDPYLQPMRNWYKRKYVIDYSFLNKNRDEINKTFRFNNHWRFKRTCDFLTIGQGKATRKQYEDLLIQIGTWCM